MKVWQYVIAGADGNTTLFGVNIFKYDWINTGEKVEVTDPLYGQKYLFSVYKVFIRQKENKFRKVEYTFAAGEFSNCVYGFYIPKED